MFFFAVLNAVLLILNLYFYNHLPAGTKLPEGSVPLFAAFVALSGVLWQTNKGFKNLLKSQENQAQLTIASQAKQADLNRQQTKEANRYNRLEQRREKADQKLTLLRALIEELKAGNVSLHGLATLCSDLAANYQGLIGQKPNVDVPMLPRFESIVYKANAEKLDMLGTAVSHVMQAYARLEKCLKLPTVKNDPQTLYMAFLGFEAAIQHGVKAIQAHLDELEKEEQKFAQELAVATRQIEALEKP